jgi:hypothetical protein
MVCTILIPLDGSLLAYLKVKKDGQEAINVS